MIRISVYNNTVTALRDTIGMLCADSEWISLSSVGVFMENAYLRLHILEPPYFYIGYALLYPRCLPKRVDEIFSYTVK